MNTQELDSQINMNNSTQSEDVKLAILMTTSRKLVEEKVQLQEEINQYKQKMFSDSNPINSA